MIKARATKGGNDILVLGLSAVNVKRIMDSKPIMFNASDIGITDVDKILVLGGDTEDDIIEDLRSLGFLR